MITKLDLFIFREICKQMSESEKAGKTLVPVSFNLSRMDFLECDIFEEIEKIVAEFYVARDMINIEITESMVMDDLTMLKNVIEKFRSNGYQVWMDDFGSGYSSLNVLQEFQFDEIKLDMIFMRKFDEKSKQIVKSIISMAKKIGVKTLAEGVETREQLEFLREIGCERVQGYYYSKPQPEQMLKETLNLKGISLETRGWRQYYDAIGAMDFLTDRPLAVVEFDGKEYKFLFVNKCYLDILTDTGRANEEMVLESMNSKLSPLSKQLREFQKKLVIGADFAQLYYTINGNYMRARAKVISYHEGKTINWFEITNLTSEEHEKDRERMDFVNRMMYAMYDTIYTFDFKTQKLESVMQGSGHDIINVDIVYDENGIDYQKICKCYIHKDDQKLFLDFINPKTILERLKESPRGYLTAFFRTLKSNGSYVWKAHYILYVPDLDMEIYATRYAPVMQKGLIDRIAPDYNAFLQDEMGSVLWHSLMNSHSISLFWKDKERRFLGANQKFLETYGFEDVSEILKKTDRDMCWHMDNDQFVDDEIQVLTEGKCVTNHLGNCIIQGVNHKIIATKEPVYKDGEIIGLLGTFMIADQLAENVGISTDVVITDQITGLMSAQGLVNAVSDYADAYKTKGVNFAVGEIVYGGYQRAILSFGDNIAKQMLGELGKIIAHEVARIHDFKIVVGRLFGGKFIFLMDYKEKRDVEKQIEYLHKKSSEIHELCGYPVTINPTSEVTYSEDVFDIQELNTIATGGVDGDMQVRHKLEEQLNYYNLQLETIVDSIDGGIMINEIYDDHCEIVYASNGIAKLSGRDSKNFCGVFKEPKDHENAYGVIKKDALRVEQAVKYAIANNSEINVTYRVSNINGHIIWVNMTGRIVGYRENHPLLMTICHNMSKATKIYEDILDEALVGVVVSETDSGEVLYQNSTARIIQDRLFDSSIEKLRKTLFLENDVTNWKVDDDGRNANGVQYELKYGKRNLFVRRVRNKWNGRKAEISYIMDITSKMKEIMETTILN